MIDISSNVYLRYRKGGWYELNAFIDDILKVIDMS